MDSAPVNWEALDTLVVDFIKSENLVEDGLSDPSPLSSPSSSSSPSSLSSSSYRSRLIIRQIRSSIESGDIEAAVDLIRTDAPFILDDRRLLFRLQKQKFIELLRRGTAADRDVAIDCLRTSLAPCALDAYPEAYEEFKHVLLAFIYDKDDQTSPVANEWAERRRFEIAGLVSSVLRACLHAYDPVFSMTLRYLISIHKGFCFHQGIASPISDLTERLLLEDRDAPATPQESLYEAPPFDEVDIQALAHAVELTRQGAIDSLRFAKGDLFQAFQNELCRMNIDLSMLDELVKEYCLYRGIVESEMQELPNTEKGNPLEAGYCSSEKSPEIDSQVIERASIESLRNDSLVIDSPTSISNETSRQGAGIELRCANEGVSSNGDCSTSWSHQCEQSRAYFRSKANPSSERIKRKRWRGRNDGAAYGSVVSFNECTTQDGSTDSSNEKQRSSNMDGKYEIVLGMKELAGRGMAAEVVDQISRMDPNFFTQNPELLFQLKQVEFLRLVSCGDHSSALKVACSYLGPLAASNPSLMKTLKETLLVFLQPDVGAPVKGLPLNALATSLQAAIGRRIGIEEPQLMKIMRATLHTHTEWFKLQMCKDRFESLLRVNFLKDVNTHLVGAATASKSLADSCAHGSSHVTTSSSTMTTEDGSSSTQGSSRDVPYDENAILKVMEFLALPRSDAIQLLAQYNGNAEMVIQQLFA